MSAPAEPLLVERAAVSPYRLPLVRPLGGSDERRGLFVLLEAGGARGVGEVAPWPGLSRVTLDEAARRLRSLLARLVGEPLPAAGPVPRFPALLAGEDPCVAWGVAAAMLSLAAAVAKVPVCRLLSPEAPLYARTAALVLTPEDVSDALASVPAAKVKVRSHRDLSLVAAVRAAMGPGELRVDGNRTLSLEQASQLARATAPFDVAFFEEPAAPDALPSLARAGIPLALDESLAEPALPPGSLMARAAALVIKPSVLGPARTFALLAGPGRKVLSSPFESAVGRDLLAQLQAAYEPETAAGLGTGRFLAEDVAALEDGCGRIDLSRPLDPTLAGGRA